MYISAEGNTFGGVDLVSAANTHDVCGWLFIYSVIRIFY